MRKKGENSVKCAGKSAIPPDENNDFTLGVESQTFPPCCLRCLSRLSCGGSRSCCSEICGVEVGCLAHGHRMLLAPLLLL